MPATPSHGRPPLDDRDARRLRRAMALFTVGYLPPDLLELCAASPDTAGPAVASAATKLTAFAAFAIAVLAGVRIWRRPGRMIDGLALLVAMGAFAAVLAGHFHHYDVAYFQLGAAVLGWAVGQVAARALTVGPPPSPVAADRLAATGMVAGLACSYFAAAMSKILAAKGSWVDPTWLRLIVAEHAWIYDPATLTGFAARSPELALAGSAYTLVIELAAPLMVMARTARVNIALGLIAWHVGLGVLTDIWFPGLPILAAMAWPSRPLDEPWVPLRLSTRRLAVATALLLIAAAALSTLGVGRSVHDLDPVPHAQTGSR